MEESLKFNSQICTTIEQSNRLLELGLKPETADMSYYILDDEPVLIIGITQVYREILKGGKIVKKQNAEIIPAWSLNRLIEMCNKTQFGMTISIYDNEVTIDGDLFDVLDNAYDNLISVIEWLIKGGRFNKEYLKQ